MIRSGRFNSNCDNSSIEIISESTLGQPALVRIEQEEYSALEQDPNTILILEKVAGELLLKNLPLGIALTPCKSIQPLDDLDGDLDIPILPSRFEGIAPFRIYHLGRGRAGVVFSWYCTKDFWRNEFGYSWKLQRARATVLAHRKSLFGVRFHRFIDYGYMAGVEFAWTTHSSGVESVMKLAYEISEAVHSMIEEALRPKVEEDWSEAEYIRTTLIPLLKNMGFRNVVFHHGPREFGWDILFSRQTEFGIPEYWAAQVKLGNVSGRSNSFIDLIVNQAQEAFKIPVLDLQTKSKIWISKFVVIITGRFTENAVEKLCEKIESHSLRNNLIFVDGEKIQELIHSSGPARRPRRRRHLNASSQMSEAF
ncbi:MAG: hypothetical protein ABIQ95_06345 [Bdellovibrionia bacterium]